MGGRLNRADCRRPYTLYSLLRPSTNFNQCKVPWCCSDDRQPGADRLAWSMNETPPNKLKQHSSPVDLVLTLFSFSAHSIRLTERPGRLVHSPRVTQYGRCERERCFFCFRLRDNRSGLLPNTRRRDAASTGELQQRGIPECEKPDPHG